MRDGKNNYFSKYTGSNKSLKYSRRRNDEDTLNQHDVSIYRRLCKQKGTRKNGIFYNQNSRLRFDSLSIKDFNDSR